MASKKTPEINGSSMADIAFLMLAFFLMTTTMDQDKGLQRVLPPMPDPSQEVEVKINKRNLIEVRISRTNSLFAAGRPVDVSQLKDLMVEYITNPTNNPEMPEREMKAIEGFGDYPVSRYVISLQNDRETSYDAYIAVQNELVRAVNEVRDNFSMQNYGKKYANLDENLRKVVRNAIPQNISEAEPKNVGNKR